MSNGNGCVLTIGGRRIYISGDTQDVPEMRALPDIDVASVCTNLPFTMTVDAAASAAREFRPRVVYPYHFSSSDVQRFKRLVASPAGSLTCSARNDPSIPMLRLIINNTGITVFAYTFTVILGSL